MHGLVRPSSHCDEDGFTSVELAIVLPVLLTIIFSIVHIGMLFHSANVVSDIATVALRNAQRETGTEASAKSAAALLVTRYKGVLNNVSVNVTRTPKRVTVIVEGDGIAVLPGLPRHVKRELSGEVEYFISEADRGNPANR
jgi:Flp pilus assembly protein TadG